MTRALWRDAMGPAWATLAAVSGLAAVLAGLRVLQGSGGAPDPGTWLWLVLLAVPASLPIAAPAAGAVGVVSALSRWVGEGAWAGALASGAAGRRLVPGALLLGALAGALTAAGTGWAEPTARRAARRAAVEAAGELVLWPGQVAEIEGVTLVPGRLEGGVARDVFLAAGDLVGGARSLEVRGESVVLGPGTLADAGDRPWRVSWGKWTRPLPTLGGPRIELAERSNADLADLVARTEARNHPAHYERAVLHKRWLHPLAALILPLCLLPLGASGRPGLRLGLVALGYLVAVRAGDHLAASIGGLAAASAGPVFVATLGIGLWASWRDR